MGVKVLVTGLLVFFFILLSSKSHYSSYFVPIIPFVDILLAGILSRKIFIVVLVFFGVSAVYLDSFYFKDSRAKAGNYVNEMIHGNIGTARNYFWTPAFLKKSRPQILFYPDYWVLSDMEIEATNFDMKKLDGYKLIKKFSGVPKWMSWDIRLISPEFYIYKKND